MFLIHQCTHRYVINFFYVQYLIIGKIKYFLLIKIIQEITNSAVLGGAYLAKYALQYQENTFEEITSSIVMPKLLCTPYSDAEFVSIKLKPPLDLI